ncbi:GGDEF domain-containing protein [Gorillibacterium sp. sgz5001074]|uniref:GGDEF domain-containing protein n=1 Tax=Gorillibacterium sp. sgz5001074 TaxID=3446695 RepID=UPI003F6814B5
MVLNPSVSAGTGAGILPMPMHMLMAQVVEQTQQGIILTDASGAILYVNPAFTVSSGYEAHEVIGRNPSLLQSGRHSREFYRSLWRSVERTGQWQGEIWNRRKNGEIYIEWLNISAIRGHDGRTTHYCAVFSDITERVQEEYKLKAENRMLEQLAMIDSLTGVANRRSFDCLLAKEWARAVRGSQPLSVLFIDIDYFKLFNDQYGHQQGDEALRRVVSVLRSGLRRSGDMLARYGGEEFAVILPDTNLAGARLVGLSLLEGIERAAIPHKGSAVSGHVTISVGCASADPAQDGSSPEMLLEAADRELYSSKKKGRNRVSPEA